MSNDEVLGVLNQAGTLQAIIRNGQEDILNRKNLPDPNSRDMYGDFDLLFIDELIETS